MESKGVMVVGGDNERTATCRGRLWRGGLRDRPWVPPRPGRKTSGTCRRQPLPLNHGVDGGKPGGFFCFARTRRGVTCGVGAGTVQ